VKAEEEEEGPQEENILEPEVEQYAQILKRFMF
jgi:hypothetical protein